MKLMKGPFRIWLPIVLLVGVVALGCDDDDLPTQPIDETPDPPTMTETFTGMFGQNSTSEHTFTVEATGDILLELTAMEPVATLTVGMGIGNVVDTADPPCVVFASDTRVVVGSELLSADAPPGEYCVSVGDVGNVFPDATVTYTLEVTHP